jgi:hypothetical protein
MRGKKKVTVGDILKEQAKETVNPSKTLDNNTDLFGDKRREKRIKKGNIKTGKFSLRTRIKNNPWVNGRPASKAVRWLFSEVFKDPGKYKHDRHLLYQGGLFMFKYFEPKYKGTTRLPWFDKFPLVLSLGPRDTGYGVRNLGFNLHLLPPRIRIIVICYIFELYKNSYRYSVFYKKDTNPVTISYHQILRVLQPFGIEFCVRMYIPKLQNEIVRFPVDDWHKAIFIPSRGYDGIRARALIKEWKQFCSEKGLKINDKINWKSVI